uniref:Uncharacterized protein n=1 Tax=Arundo donax TaxID=35708 RepID=A0A0A9FTP6_ARUDO
MSKPSVKEIAQLQSVLIGHVHLDMQRPE